jgi:hypothetical protein
MNQHDDADSHSFPNHVAELLYEEFQYSVESTNPLELAALRELFELLFFASLHTDELQAITFKTICIDPDDPDPCPPQFIRADRWTPIPFKSRMPLNVKSLVKLSRATHPTTSAIAVWHDEKGWFAWGFIDQQWGRFTFVHREGEGYYGKCGLFEAVVTAAGSIEVFDNLRMICALRHGRLVRNQPDVFARGPVHDRILHYIRSHEREVRTILSRGTLTHGPSLIVDPSEIRCVSPHVSWDSQTAAYVLATQDFSDSLAWSWAHVICRLLLTIQRYKHGGGVLIVPSSATDDRLNIAHPIEYNRLMHTMNASSVMSAVAIAHAELDNAQRYEQQIDDCQRAITGCIRFISSMSCMDGVILLDDSLIANGFGVEIRVPNELTSVFLAGDAHASPENLRERPCERYGTRHRSIMRYCKANPESLGFVVSQDGGIRAIACENSKVVMWEDIRVDVTYTSGR